MGQSLSVESLQQAALVTEYGHVIQLSLVIKYGHVTQLSLVIKYGHVTQLKKFLVTEYGHVTQLKISFAHSQAAESHTASCVLGENSDVLSLSAVFSKCDEAG